jgi:hypothetical protein
MKIDKHTLSLAAEFAVASELCRRNIYAQLTLGLHKKTDLLIETDNNMLRIQVKAKQGREWPGVKGTNKYDLILVLVDYQDKQDTERPDFYILTASDWKKFILELLDENIKAKSVKISDEYVPIWSDGYHGTGIKANHLIRFKDRWNKIEKMVKET